MSLFLRRPIQKCHCSAKGSVYTLSRAEVLKYEYSTSGVFAQEMNLWIAGCATQLPFVRFMRRRKDGRLTICLCSGTSSAAGTPIQVQ